MILLVSIPFQITELAASPNKTQAAPLKGGKVVCTVELLTGLEGVDFNSSLRSIYQAVKQRWYANMPPSVEKGQQGSNRVEFQIQRDGNIVKDSFETDPVRKE